jgi:hypothetical protein
MNQGIALKGWKIKESSTWRSDRRLYKPVLACFPLVASMLLSTSSFFFFSTLPLTSCSVLFRFLSGNNRAQLAWPGSSAVFPVSTSLPNSTYSFYRLCSVNLINLSNWNHRHCLQVQLSTSTTFFNTSFPNRPLNYKFSHYTNKLPS